MSPNPSWTAISGSAPVVATFSNAAQTIHGINVPITLQLNRSGPTTGVAYRYSLNGGAWTVWAAGATISASVNNTLAFQVSKISAGTASGSISVVNQSDSNTQIGSFSFSVTGTTQ